MRRCAPAAERNAEPIREVLARVLPPRGAVLEIASGTGQHVAHLARAFPALAFQPSDLDPDNLDSVRAWCEGLENVAPPVVLDAAAPDWPVERADAIVAINLIHIAPMAACEGLFAGAARLLDAGAPLVLYGPYLVEGRETAPSNLAFDQMLRDRDPRWGLRRLGDVAGIGERAGLSLVETVEMPANNLSLIFRRR